MEVYDEMGQFICNGYPLKARRKTGPSTTMTNVPTPTIPGSADTILHFTIKDEVRASIEPYPFDIDQFPVSFQGRLIPRRPYGTQDEFLHEYYRVEQIYQEIWQYFKTEITM